MAKSCVGWTLLLSACLMVPLIITFITLLSPPPDPPSSLSLFDLTYPTKAQLLSGVIPPDYNPNGLTIYELIHRCVHSRKEEIRFEDRSPQCSIHDTAMAPIRVDFFQHFDCFSVVNFLTNHFDYCSYDTSQSIHKSRIKQPIGYITQNFGTYFDHFSANSPDKSMVLPTSTTVLRELSREKGGMAFDDTSLSLPFFLTPAQRAIQKAQLGLKTFGSTLKTNIDVPANSTLVLNPPTSDVSSTDSSLSSFSHLSPTLSWSSRLFSSTDLERDLDIDYVYSQYLHYYATLQLPLLQKHIHYIRSIFGLFAKSGTKTIDGIYSKSKRSTILEQEPWYNVYYIRDALRAKIRINSVDEIKPILGFFLLHGYTIVQADYDKFTNPKGFWGWRPIAFDLRAPTSNDMVFNDRSSGNGGQSENQQAPNSSVPDVQSTISTPETTQITATAVPTAQSPKTVPSSPHPSFDLFPSWLNPVLWFAPSAETGDRHAVTPKTPLKTKMRPKSPPQSPPNTSTNQDENTGFIIELYFVPYHMDLKDTKGNNHHLYEKWRNMPLLPIFQTHLQREYDLTNWNNGYGGNPSDFSRFRAILSGNPNDDDLHGAQQREQLTEWLRLRSVDETVQAIKGDIDIMFPKQDKDQHQKQPSQPSSCPNDNNNNNNNTSSTHQDAEMPHTTTSSNGSDGLNTQHYPSIEDIDYSFDSIKHLWLDYQNDIFTSSMTYINALEQWALGADDVNAPADGREGGYRWRGVDHASNKKKGNDLAHFNQSQSNTTTCNQLQNDTITSIVTDNDNKNVHNHCPNPTTLTSLVTTDPNYDSNLVKSPIPPVPPTSTIAKPRPMANPHPQKLIEVDSLRFANLSKLSHKSLKSRHKSHNLRNNHLNIAHEQQFDPDIPLYGTISQAEHEFNHHVNLNLRQCDKTCQSVWENNTAHDFKCYPSVHRRG